MARPSKLTAEVQRTLTFALGEGATVEHACAYAGISPATYYSWVARAEAGEDEFLEFLESVTRARGHGIVTDLCAISDAVRAHDWHAAAWRLQHRYPAEYGAKLKISGDADHPLRVVTELPQDQLEARIARLLEELGYAGGVTALPAPEETAP